MEGRCEVTHAVSVVGKQREDGNKVGKGSLRTTSRDPLSPVRPHIALPHLGTKCSNTGAHRGICIQTVALDTL